MSLTSTDRRFMRLLLEGRNAEALWLFEHGFMTLQDATTRAREAMDRLVEACQGKPREMKEEKSE